MIKECHVYEEHFAALLDGQLTWGEKTAMQRHVEECPNCRHELLAIKRHWDAVEQLCAVPAQKKPQKFRDLLRLIAKIIWPPSSRPVSGKPGCP